MAGFRLSDDEVWEFAASAHTGVMATLRRDGTPIALPLWFACIDREIYARTRGKKLLRIANDSRASFLVETGDFWAELKAVHLTGTAAVVSMEGELLAQAEAELASKYDSFRLPPDSMPTASVEHYAATMRWVKFTPTGRVLSWDNDKIVGAS
jgi:nitroimidazol reductase NimA-like FMN-containing flavoprotein (pyridoxamine 5'-phosphate oxidase superfamily)